MGIVFAVDLMVKTPSLFAPLMPVATVWTHSGRKPAATAPAGQGALLPRLQRLQLMPTPQVVLSPLVQGRGSMLSLPSSGHVIRRPCRTGGSGCVSSGLVYTLFVVMLASSPNYLSMSAHVKVIIP